MIGIVDPFVFVRNFAETIDRLSDRKKIPDLQRWAVGRSDYQLLCSSNDLRAVRDVILL